MKRLFEKFLDPKIQVWFHGVMTIMWLLLIPISMFTSLKFSIMWLVLMSAWANFASHFAGWEAASTHKEVNNTDNGK